LGIVTEMISVQQGRRRVLPNHPTSYDCVSLFIASLRLYLNSYLFSEEEETQEDAFVTTTNETTSRGGCDGRLG
jgi:hypothetical protein